MNVGAKKKGMVILAGAGPGDPALATAGMLAELAKADVVVYDYLANEALFRHSSAIKICVGKRAGAHSWVQQDINRLLVKLGRQGKRVLRLKGGDPFVFGRGGEEALVLKAAGIPFEVLPGVTSGVAALAYAGIPLTHRGLATSAVFVTGQEKSGKPLSLKTIQALARLDATLVFYMATAHAQRICSALIKAGKKPGTPAALVHQGTLPGQKTLVSTLAGLPARMAESGLGSPGLIVVGPVVGLRKRLAWLEERPLFGQSIAVTRSQEQASKLCEGLRQLGAEVLEIPTIRFKPLAVSKAALKNALTSRWLLVTSVNGAERLHQVLLLQGLDARALGGLRVAAVGSATAEALCSRGINPGLVPQTFDGASLAKALLKADRSLRGRVVTLARAQDGREDLPAVLKAAGAKVRELPLYANVPDRSHAAELERAVMGSLNLAAFASSSSVRNFQSLLSAPALRRALSQVKALCMGPITADTARKAGFKVALVSPKATIPDFLDAIEAYGRKLRA